MHPCNNSIGDVDVVVLCGGLGTRLRPVVADRPKPMAPVRGRPFLEYVVDSIAARGFTRFVFCVGHMPQVIVRNFSGYRGLDVLFSEETELLGTAGALKLCEPLIAGSRMLIVNGDSICALDYGELVDVHCARGTVMTTALAVDDERRDGGFVRLAPNGLIEAFQEKDRDEGTPYINAGIHVAERSIFELMASGVKCSLEKDVIPRLLGRGVAGYVTTEPCYDIGTPERLKSFERAMGGMDA